MTASVVLKKYPVRTLPGNHPGIFNTKTYRGIKAVERVGFMVFGQNESNLPVRHLQVGFNLKIDDNSMDDSPICAIDICRDHRRVAQRALINRKDFIKAGQWQTFVLDFTPEIAKTIYEFRIFYIGYALLMCDFIWLIEL